MANEVVFYTNEDVGAPTLNNAAGSLIEVLYACLVSGYNVQTATSVSVSAGVATLALVGHGFVVGKMIELSGATPAGLNGRKVPLTVTSGTLTFDATGVATGTATGTITVKRPGLGWTRPANTGNVAIFARSDVTATAQVLRVDDSGAGVAGPTYARATMLETWSDVNTFTGQAPMPAQLSGGQYWTKGGNSTAAKQWVLVGDSKLFYLFTDNESYPFVSNVGLGGGGTFGDPVSYRAGDPYGAILGGGASSAPLQTTFLPQNVGSTPPGPGLLVSRAFNQLGGSVYAQPIGASDSVFGSRGPVYPSPVDNGALFAGQILVSEKHDALGNPVRGELPGLLMPLCRGVEVLHLNVLDGVPGAGRKTLIVAVNYYGQKGAVGIDVTGPWR